MHSVTYHRHPDTKAALGPPPGLPCLRRRCRPGTRRSRALPHGALGAGELAIIIVGPKGGAGELAIIIVGSAPARLASSLVRALGPRRGPSRPRRGPGGRFG